MSMRTMFLTIFGTMILSTPVLPTNAQITEQAAREQTRNAVRLELHLKRDQFLGVQRDEKLEQLLAIAVGRPDGLQFVYQVSQAGDEVKENAIVHHIFTDVDPTYIVAVSIADGTTYRIHGFGDSLAEFERMTIAIRMKVLSPDQAEAVSDFYRKVNPQGIPLTPIMSLIELKQAAERQCQTSSFDKGEKAFDAWWNNAKPLYAGTSFGQTAVPHGGGYLVQWVILSSAGSGLCGGAPLRAQLEVQKDGQIRELKFIPLRPN